MCNQIEHPQYPVRVIFTIKLHMIGETGECCNTGLDTNVTSQKRAVITLSISLPSSFLSSQEKLHVNVSKSVDFMT